MLRFCNYCAKDLMLYVYLFPNMEGSKRIYKKDKRKAGGEGNIRLKERKCT